MVCDYFNHRVQVFGLSGKFITKFGSEGSRGGEVPTPVAIASLCDGRVVVSDGHNHPILVFDQMCSYQSQTIAFCLNVFPSVMEKENLCFWL